MPIWRKMVQIEFLKSLVDTRLADIIRTQFLGGGKSELYFTSKKKYGAFVQLQI